MKLSTIRNEVLAIFNAMIEGIGEVLATLAYLVLGLLMIVLGAIFIFGPFLAGPIVGLLWWVVLLIAASIR